MVAIFNCREVARARDPPTRQCLDGVDVPRLTPGYCLVKGNPGDY